MDPFITLPKFIKHLLCVCPVYRRELPVQQGDMLPGEESPGWSSVGDEIHPRWELDGMQVRFLLCSSHVQNALETWRY